MKQRFFELASLVSSFPLCVSASFWVRSYIDCDLWSDGYAGVRHYTWDVSGKSHALSSYPPPRPPGASLWLLSGFGTLSFREERFVPGPRTHLEQGHSWSTDDKMFPSFEFTYSEPDDMRGLGWFRYREIALCYWAQVIVFSMLPLIFLCRVLSIPDAWALRFGRVRSASRFLIPRA